MTITHSILDKCFMLIIAIVLNYSQIVKSQALSEEELKFKQGYDAMLSGQHELAYDIFYDEVFNKANYSAIPYFRKMACIQNTKCNKKLIRKAAKLAKEQNHHWGAAITSSKHQKLAYPIVLAKAQAGNVLAQSDIGDLYYLGFIVEKDHKKALMWYKKSADQGFAPAMYNVGAIYYYGKQLGIRGNRIKKDKDQARFWLQKASDRGLIRADKLLRKLK